MLDKSVYEICCSSQPTRPTVVVAFFPLELMLAMLTGVHHRVASDGLRQVGTFMG